MSQYPQPDPGHQSWDAAPTQEERNWALLSHLGALVTAWFAFGFIAPLITLLAKGNSSPFVRRHSIASLNFQLSMLIYSVVGTILIVVVTIVTLGLALVLIIPLVAVLLLALLAFVIIASVKAANGEDYRYPLTLPLLS